MKKLISAKDYIILVWEMAELTYIQKLHLLVAYANFLSKKLELWMFIPCKLVDGVWVVLEEPKENYYFGAHGGVYPSKKQRYDKELKEYQEAKYRVLFEGFEIRDNFEGSIVLSMIGKNQVYSYLKKQEKFFFHYPSHAKIIEDLVNYNLELTSTAQKQLS